MKNSFKLALATVALAALGTGARADLTINGEVGLPLNPTAQIPEPGGFRVQANYYELGDIAGVDNKLYGVTAATRAGDMLEISGGVHRLDYFNEKDTGFSLGAKYLFTRETDPEGVRLAVGAGLTDIGDVSSQRVYGVATKYLGRVTEGRAPITGHLGIRYDRFDIDRFGIGESDRVGGFVGVEVPLGETFNIVGELGTKIIDGGRSTYSLSARYRQKGQPLGASIGIARTGLINDSGKLFGQVGYTF